MRVFLVCVGVGACSPILWRFWEEQGTGCTSGAGVGLDPAVCWAFSNLCYCPLPAPCLAMMREKTALAPVGIGASCQHIVGVVACVVPLWHANNSNRGDNYGQV